MWVSHESVRVVRGRGPWGCRGHALVLRVLPGANGEGVSGPGSPERPLREVTLELQRDCLSAPLVLELGRLPDGEAPPRSMFAGNALLSRMPVLMPASRD
jgi:hypothetical protein